VAEKKQQTALYIAPEPVRMGRPRKIGCVEEMWTLWEEYCRKCDSHMKTESVITKGLTGTTVDHVLVAAPLTYTKKGFCLHIGITESSFDATYGEDEDYDEFMEMLRMAAEIDARSKFEDGTLNSKLAAIWMGHYDGYSVKTETEAKFSGGGLPIVITGEDDLTG